MLKPIMVMYPVIPARDEEERAALRPIQLACRVTGWAEESLSNGRFGGLPDVPICADCCVATLCGWTNRRSPARRNAAER